MKVTCALSSSQIEKLYANVYGHMLNQKEAFDAKQYMTDLFNKIAKAKDVDTASKFLQQVPSLIGIASFRPTLQDFEIKTDLLRPLIKQFKKEENGLINTVNYFNPTLNPEVQKELVIEAANLAYTITEADGDSVIPSNFNNKPLSALSTTFQEFIQLNPNQTIDVETLDAGKKTIYNTLSAISSIANNNTSLRELIYENTSLKLQPVSIDKINIENLDKTTASSVTRALHLTSTGQAQPNVTIPSERFLMIITDAKGNYLFFNETGNITTKELGGSIVYQFLRDVRKENNIYRVTDIYGKQDQIMTPSLISKNLGIPVEKALKQQQQEFKELYEFRQNLIKSQEQPLVDIVGISTGASETKPEKLNLSNITSVLEDNDAAISSIVTVKSERTGGKKGEAVITIKGEEHVIDRPNLTADVARKIAAALTNKNLSNLKKYNFVTQFLANNASQATRKHRLKYLPNTDKLIYSYSPTTYKERLSIFIVVNLDIDASSEIIYNSLMEASGVKGDYFGAKMTYNAKALNDNQFLDYDLGANKLNEDYSSYTEFLKTLPNTTVSIDLTKNTRTFNNNIEFALPNEFTAQLAKAKENTDIYIKDDLFDTLTDSADVEPILGVKQIKEKVVSILKTGTEIIGTISKPFGAVSRWNITTSDGMVIDFYNRVDVKSGNIDAGIVTNADIVKGVTLILIPEIEVKGKKFIDVVEVRSGNKLLGYVRESEIEDFNKPSDIAKQPVIQKSVEEIEVEINNVIDAKGEAKPEDKGAADVFFFRNADLPSDVTEEQVSNAKKWWANSLLNKHVGFREVANIVNSDAYARFIVSGATLNGNLGMIDLAAKGSMVDVYHEAWHAFSQLYLSRADKKALYKEVQKKLGSKADFFTIEEHLAESFREYARTGRTQKESPKRNSLFRKILNFLRELFGKGSVTDVTDIKKVKDLFDNLYLGTNLNNYLPSVDNVMFDLLYRNSGIVKTGTKTEQVLNRQDSNLLKDSMDSIISEISDEQTKIKKSKSVTLSLLLDSRNREPLYKLIKVKLDEKLTSYKEALDNTEDIEINAFKKEILENRIRILQAGVDNYGDTDTGLIKYHVDNSSFDLIKQKYTALELDEEGNLFDPQNIENSERYGDKKEGSKTLIQLAGKETLFILKSLHQGSINKKTKEIDYVYNNLGFKKLADFRTTWNSTVRAIAGMQDPQKMYDALVKESLSNVQFKQLVENKLANPETTTNNHYEFQAITSLWQAFSKSRVPYIQLSVFKTQAKEINTYGESVDKFITRSSMFEDDSYVRVYDYTSSVTEASSETLNIINNFKNKFSSSITNPYVDRVGRENIPTLNIQKIVNDFGIDGKLDIEKSFNFARAIGIHLDDLSIIKNTLKKNTDTIEQFGLPYIFTIIKKLSDLENKPFASSNAKALIVKFKTEPLETLMSSKVSKIQGLENINQKKQIKAIAELQARYGLDSSNTMVLNAERNLVSEHIENNTISKITFALNNAKVLSDLWTTDEFQYMSYMDPTTNPYTKRLATIRSLFDLNSAKQTRRNNKSLLLFMNSGTQIMNGTGVNTTNLDVNSKMLQEMNTMLKDGIQEFMRHASKSASFGARIEGGVIGLPGKEGSDKNLWVDLNMFADGTASDYAFKAHMLPYMEAEAERIYMFKQNKNIYKNYIGYNRDIGGGLMAGEVFTAFDNVLTTASKNAIYKGIDKALADNKTFNLKEFLNADTTGLLNIVKRNVKSYFDQQTKINDSDEVTFVDKELTNAMVKAGVSEDNVKNKLIEAYTYNSWIHNFEMAILFYGDISQYNHAVEELHKRNPGATSGGPAFRTDIAARKFVNSFLASSSYAKKEGLTPIIYNGTFNTAVVQDVKRTSVYLEQIEAGLREAYTKQYEKYKIPNAKAEIDRRVAIEISKYKNIEEADGQGFITFDAYRNLRYLEDAWSNDQESLFQKIKNGEEITISDTIELFPVYKLQNFGHLANTGLPVNAMHKFVLAPLIPSVIAGSDLESLHKQMMIGNIQYITFQTGSKVGSVTSNGSADIVYEKGSDEKILKKDIAFTKNTIYLENLKNVTNVPSKYKNKTVFSTQLRKLILSNMYSEGKIINSDNEKAVKRYEEAVENYSELLKLELLHEIHYTYDKTNNKYTGNLHDFLDVVQKELERKDIPEHLIHLVGLNRDNSLKTDLSIHLLADEIETILVALVEKRFIKQKVKGEALVQVSSAMSNGIWDSNLKKGTEAEVQQFLGTNNLPFYRRNADGTTNAMKVAIALQGDFVNLLKTKHLDGKPVETIVRLNEMIKNDDWLNLNNNRKSVTLSAVRIPVQGINSMEFMEVYAFLDPSAGPIIIPPTEIVAKSGTDFDGDKLTTFMPAIDAYGRFVRSSLTNDQVLDKVRAADKSSVASSIIKNQKAALENELITTISEILALSDNYASLVKPNDTYLLKNDIADKLAEYVTDYDRFSNMHNEAVRLDKNGKKIISPTRTLEVSYNLHKHEVNMVGKKVLGMIAIENSLHPMMNSIGVSLPAKYKNLKYNASLGRNVEGKKEFLTRLLLRHNKTKDGRISLSNIYSVDGLDSIGELFSQMLNGAVDVEKDAWIFFIQGNYETLPILLFLLKAGVPKKEAILFVSNPLVREYTKQQRTLKSTYAKITGFVEDDFENSFVKYQAGRNTLIKYVGEKESFYPTSNKKYYNTVQKATSRSGILNNAGNFDIALMTRLVEDPKNPAYEKHAIAMFLHFLELEKSTRGFTALKFMANPDTKTSKTLQELIRRNLTIDEGKALSTLEEGTIEKLQDSILGTFFDNKLISDLIIPVFPLRNNDIVTNYIVKKFKNNSVKITKSFGSTQDGARNFITAFKNAIPNYIFQNYMTNFVDEKGNLISMPKEYKGMDVVIKAGIKTGAEVIDGKLYVDEVKLKKQYAKKLYDRSNTTSENYASDGLRGFMNIEELFPNESTYFKYVFEREHQRSMYSLVSIKDSKDFKRLNDLIKDEKQAYEAYLNKKALINSFNRKAIMDLKGQSFTDLILNIIEDYPILTTKYDIISQFTKPNIATGQEVLSLNDVSALKDSQIAEIYHQNLLDLADETVKKVIDPVENKKISKAFEMLPLMSIYQNGIGYSKYGFNKALPYSNFIGVMQTASEIFMSNQLNNNTLDYIFDVVTDTKNKNFKNYVVSSQEYNNPLPIVPVIDTISEDEADALLQKMNVSSQEPLTLEQSKNIDDLKFIELNEKIKTKLQQLYPEIKLEYSNNPIWEQGDNVFNQEEFNNQVQYRLKATEILLSTKADEVFRKGDKNNWNIDKILTELNVPKQQQELIKSFNTRNREQIVTNLLSNYSYTVEINTAKEKGKDYKMVDLGDGNFEPEPFEPDYDYDDEGNPFLTEQGIKDIEEIEGGINNTQHYSNLSAPGSTEGKSKYEGNPDWEYHELEFKTPAITPSIRGHAQFATHNGIGWARVWYNKKTGAVEIQEIQSDLFQKGRDKDNLINGSSLIYTLSNKNNKWQVNEPGIGDRKLYKEFNTKEEAILLSKELNKGSTFSKENQFLQLLNKDNNWVTFFVKSIIQDSAKKGYEKVLFPVGDTAAKVEGLQTVQGFIDNKEARINELNKNQLKYFATDMGNDWSPSGNETKKFNTKEEADLAGKEADFNSYEINVTKGVDNTIEIYQLETEIADAKSGKLKISSIAKFYEETVFNVLKKQGYSPIRITDEYGNGWYEVGINQTRELSNILLQRNEANRIIGQANIKAMTVLIDAVNQKADTLPHEYAHHYISWYRNSPIVQEAIKKWGSEEALVQSIGEQVVLQKGEALNWWNNFVKWILDKFNNLSKLDKQQLTNILTDAFLTRQDLGNKNVLTSEQNKNIDDLKSIEPAYAPYTNEQIQDFIESKIPDSKVKSPNYHGGKTNTDDFVKLKNKEDYEYRNPNSILGFFFSNSYITVASQYAQKDYDSIKSKLTGDNETDSFIMKSAPNKKGSVSPNLLNIKNPFIIQAKEWENESWVDKLNILTKEDKDTNWASDYKWTVDAYEKIGKHLKNLGYDSIYVNSDIELYNKTGIVDYITIQKVVFEPSQITILTSPKTIAEFKKFVGEQLTPEQNKNIEDLKFIEPAFADYTNEQIQSFIESKIPTDQDFNKKLITFFNNFGITFKEGDSSVDILRKIAYINPANENQDFINSSSKLLVQLLQASPNINFNHLQDLIEDTAEFKTNIKKQPEIEKIYDYLKAGNRIPMDEWVKYIAEYNKIKNSILEKFLQESLLDAKNNNSELHKFINKFLQWFKDLFNSAKNVKEITDAIISQVLVNNKEIILGDNNLQGKERVTLEKALSESKHGENIIKFLSSEGLTLVGSVAVAEQGSVYRKLGHLMHDIDWVVPFDYTGDPSVKLLTEFKGSQIIREFDSPTYYTKTYIVPPKGYKVTNMTFFKPDEFGKNKYIASYDVVDSKGKVVSNYRRYYDVSVRSNKVTENREVYNEGLQNVPKDLNAASVDLFYNKEEVNYQPVKTRLSDGTELTISHWLSAFTEKLKYSRNKDLVDWVNFTANTFKNNSLTSPETIAEFKKFVGEQLTPEQNKNIDDLKSIEPAYAPYTNEQIQSFIESKIPDSEVKETLLKAVGEDLNSNINILSENDLLEYLKNNKTKIKFDFLNTNDRLNNDKIYQLIRTGSNIKEINKLISQSKNLALNNFIIPKGIILTNPGYTIIGNATDFTGITFNTNNTVKIKSIITSDIFNGKNINSNIIADNSSEQFKINVNKKTSDKILKKISKYQSILNTGLAPKKNFEHTALITNEAPLGYTLGLTGEKWNIEIGADTDKFPNDLYESFRINHIGNRKLTNNKPLGWVGGTIINDTLVITELQSDLLQNTFEISNKIKGVSKSSVENYFDGWEYVFLNTAINQMLEKYPNIKFVSLPSSTLYTSKIQGAKNISKLYDKLAKEYNFIKIKKQQLNITPYVTPIDKFQATKGFVVTDKNGRIEKFNIEHKVDGTVLTSDKGYRTIIPFDKFKKVIINKTKGGKWRIFNYEQAINIFQSFAAQNNYFDKYQDNKYFGFNVIKISDLSKPIINNFTKEYYDVYIKTYLKSFVKEMKISNPDLASEFELAYDAIDFSKDDINLKQFYNSKQGIIYLENLNGWIEKEFSKEIPKQDNNNNSDNNDEDGILVDSEGNEIGESYQESEIDKLIKQTNKKETNNNYTISNQDYLLDELNIAIKEKNKTRQDVIKQILLEINTKGESSIKYNVNGKIQGFTHNGNIFLNKNAANSTLIEEAAHLWLIRIKKNNIELYNEGINKVKNSSYIQDVLNNSFYIKEALKEGDENSKEYENYILEEALSKAIKDEGKQLSNDDKKSFFNWLRNLYNELLDMIGLGKLSIDEVKKLSLSDFSKKALVDIFNIKNNQNNTINKLNSILNSPKTIAEFKKFVGKKDTVESLRAEEQVELQQAFPSVTPVNGKIEKESLNTKEDIAKFEKIYDRYDKMITPLLDSQSKNIKLNENKPDGLDPIPRSSTDCQ